MPVLGGCDDEEERRRESIGIYTPDYEALAHIHHHNALRTADDQRYLALGRVLECWNGKVLFDVHPLLWFAVGDYEKANLVEPQQP